VNVNGGNAYQAAPLEVGAADINVNQTFAAGTSDQLLSLAFTAANVQGVWLLATQNMTIKTNSSGSPAQTISLVAGIPLYWEASAGYFTNPFTSDVTAFYVSCTSAATLKGHIVTS
jgi:hypothetical protein